MYSGCVRRLTEALLRLTLDTLDPLIKEDSFRTGLKFYINIHTALNKSHLSHYQYFRSGLSCPERKDHLTKKLCSVLEPHVLWLIKGLFLLSMVHLSYISMGTVCNPIHTQLWCTACSGTCPVKPVLNLSYTSSYPSDALGSSSISPKQSPNVHLIQIS